MILYKLVKNNNKKFPGTYGKYYARPAVTATISIDQLAEHMSSHNTPFSAGAVRGILTDMVKCVKELVLSGYSVKIDDLAIFSIGIRPQGGRIKMRSPPKVLTGNFRPSQLSFFLS